SSHSSLLCCCFTSRPFFLSFPFTYPPTTDIYTLSLHDALPISLSLDSIADKDYYIFGMTPTMALYLIAILPSAVIICLLYAITFTHGNMSNNTNENHELDEVIK